MSKTLINEHLETFLEQKGTQMLTSERQEKILETIQSKKYCTVDFLAKHFFVAPITIRRDLACLEAAGLIKLCHGGASSRNTKTGRFPTTYGHEPTPL